MVDQPWTSKFHSLDTHTFSTQDSDLGLHSPTQIIVRNPPRTYLAPDSGHFCEDLETRFLEKSVGVTTRELYVTYPGSHPVTSGISSSIPDVSCRQGIRMPKKRPSLQSLFAPSFLSPPTSPTSADFGALHQSTDYIPRARSSSSVEQVLRTRTTSQHNQSPSVTSPRSSPPPAFLIDDDPFANLSLMSSASSSHSTPLLPPPPTSPRSQAPPTPRSPLTPSTAETQSISFIRPPSTTVLPSGISRTLSGRARPAYQKPAFSSRPSLPSLDTLAKMNVVLSPKVRKGRVGAKLPSEPWNNLRAAQTVSATSPSSPRDATHPFSLPSPSGVTDFVSELDSDFLDFSSDEEMDEEMGETESTLRLSSLNYSTVLHTAHTSRFDLTLNMDAESSVGDLSPRTLSPTPSSSLFSLTRSTSFTSNSSAESSDAHQWPTFSSHNNSISSAESDSDILSSPPDDFLSFPTSRFSPNAITDPYWSSYSRLDIFDLETDARGSLFSDGTYIREPEVIYEPGTSADTVRPSALKTDPASHPGSQLHVDVDEVVDGVGWEGHGGNHRRVSEGSGISRRENGGTGRSDGNLRGSARGGFGGRGDDDDEDDRRRNDRSTFSTPSDSELSDETEDESTDDYGEEPVPGAASRGSSDDDIPLAQRIPTALQAQRTIRKQVREERDKRRKERALRGEQGAPVRSRQVTLRPAVAGDPFAQSAVSSSQEAALHASMSMRRPRTKTLPSNAARPFSPEDLSRRLLTMEVAGTSSTRHHRSPSPSFNPRDVGAERSSSVGRSLRDAGPVSRQTTEVTGAPTTRHYNSPSTSVKPYSVSAERPKSASRTLGDPGHALQTPIGIVGASTMRHRRAPSMSAKSKDVLMERPRSAGRNLRDPGPVLPNPLPEGSRALRPMRSFHKPEHRAVDDYLSAPMPVDAEQKLGRSLTRTRPREEPVVAHSHSNTVNPHPLPIPTALEDKLTSRRLGEESRKLLKTNPESKSTRPSLEVERPTRPSLQRPPVPPLPLADPSISVPAGRGHLAQQRVFIGDMQRFNMVEIGPSTNGGDVIEMMEAQGSLNGWVGSGGWMVWEIAQDFGMERPVRSFELLSDIQASWNKDKMMNAFLIRLTPLAVPLSRSAIPSASPMHAGYVDWESKRGKWNKRWLQLREHSLYLSKRDNGRDEMFLCSLSNFDAYYITRLHKSPRPFAFAVKSTDNLSFFENKADYLHIFCCGEKEGQVWMEKILVARSYVLHQEKHVLFHPKASNGNAAGGLARAGTRKTSSARPSQPLAASAPPHMGPLVSLARNDVFEPGSLLHKQI